MATVVGDLHQVQIGTQNQGQIFTLQTNLPHIGMAKYALKRFAGKVDEDIDEFVKDYRLYLMAANIITANAASK
ncbi:hypothetical protein RCL_jg24156.t1 [Rhizophagus clarus]|uniref:Uncharacterized protein n=1 Tax=Rhizophagus clarus TaxID=94130 RepID=A0A8H3LFX2_9GLOM|nr:hypothetical protein RCL_jg24156.t1 [Rhizophagus clarus]